jgi:hypothetical protein
MLADIAVDRLGIATILLLSRPERERLHLAIRRELASSDGRGSLRDERHERAHAVLWNRQRPGIGENAYGWGYMGYWPAG